MKTIKRLSMLIILVGLIVSTYSCGMDNDLITGLSENPVVQAVAKWMGFNLNKDSRVKGVFEIELKGTQAFDANYYGWPQGGLSCEPTISTLRDDNKTVCQYFSSYMGGPKVKRAMWGGVGITSPELGYVLENISVYTPFADGSFPDQYPYFSGACPMFAQTWKTESYDKDDTLVEDTTTNRTMTYENGLPATQTKEYSDGTKRVYTYGADPFDGSYYQTGYSDYDAEENLTSNNTNTRSRTVSGSVTTDTRTYVNKNSDDEVTYRRVETWVRDSSEKTETYTRSRYHTENDDSEYDRTVEVIVYNNYPLRQITSVEEKGYDVDGEEVTLTDHYKEEYENGFFIKKIDYNTGTSESDDVRQVRNYQRDAQGRVTDYTSENSEGQVDSHRVYTFDSSGRVTSTSYYDVNTEDGTETCSEGKYEYTYSMDSSGNKVFTTTQYECEGGNISQTPFRRWVYAYNQKGLLVLMQRWGYNTEDEKFDLVEQVSFEYNSNGAMVQTTYYSVTDDVAEENGKTTFEYDSNLFQTVVKHYNGDDLAGCPTCEPCESGSDCYTKQTYTY